MILIIYVHIPVIFIYIYTLIWLIGNILFGLSLNYELLASADPACVQKGIVVSFPI